MLITWKVYGKILTISNPAISYAYDLAGNRISKTVGTSTTCSGISGISRVNFEYNRKFSFFMAAMVHQAFYNAHETPSGTMPSKSVGSLEISAGMGYEFGGKHR